MTFSTDQTGANTQIDIDHTTIYNFYVLPGQSVTGILGDFTIKRGSKTTEPITFSLWSGVDGLGTRLASISLAASSVSQSYESRIFDLDPLGAPLGPGSYSVQLSSMTGDQGSRQYFFKGGRFQSSDPAAVSTVPPPSGGGTPPAVPEPSTVLSAALGSVAALALARRRHRPGIGTRA
ncbi:MAG: PEP-CTERM sorting domain-containing protein [Isosphaeraceae bacterium]|nr:PEP-CTERM sorting domain-containing protein [Isosphaeraceae bacterium]